MFLSFFAFSISETNYFTKNLTTDIIVIIPIDNIQTKNILLFLFDMEFMHVHKFSESAFTEQ